ncbi:DUF3102 domain-containing protein [Aliiroseovarius sp. M344]|uniref:DUF3102 domain-containing protein n=1 Tax=Aliiroseovarius sp. M344 TaxID=2867010 RepID=UPI0021ADE86E|nr:DUF3102 domain-containing protein [Aliiroseovarius sp. M344]UWQ15661.1 DUF3102 domain-containing protein [Aliiroseovarius sp. M344]
MLDHPPPDRCHPTRDSQSVDLTPDCRLALAVNSKHREVQRLGRTAKEIAAEIGEALIKVKQKLAHGEFGPWCDANLTFSKHTRARYIKVAEIKSITHATFRRAESINEVLDYKSKPEPPKQTRAATLDDLRKVEKLRAVLDDPATPDGIRSNAKAQLDKIEREVGAVEPQPKAKPSPKQPTGQSPRHAVRLRACAVLDRVAPNLVGNPRSMIISALMIAYGDTPEKIEELLEALKGTK